jgi:hypothetical protein
MKAKKMLTSTIKAVAVAAAPVIAFLALKFSKK